MDTTEPLVSTLTGLGFSQYEAKAYVGMLETHGQTAYALSKSTGVPQPKVYEAVRKLVARGAAVQVGQDPQRFTAVRPETLLEELESNFQGRLGAAKREIAAYVDSGPTEWPEVLSGVRGHSGVLARAAQMIRESGTKLYLSAWGDDLRLLADELSSAERRGVTVVVLAFGRTSFRLRRGQLYHHTSTTNNVYPGHRNRHLALVADGTQALWAQGIDGNDWSALVAEDERMVGLVRGFIRHDIYVQKIHSRLGPEMQEIFGPGLELLADVTVDETLQARPAATGERRRSAS